METFLIIICLGIYFTIIHTRIEKIIENQEEILKKLKENE